MKILIVSCFFPPQNAIASQRPYSWAKHWARAGHDVTVLTPTKDLSKADLTPLPFNGFRVLEVPPLGLFGWLRTRLRGFIAEKQTSADSTSKSAPPARQPGLLKRILRYLRAKGLFSGTRMPDAFDLWIPPAVQALPKEKFDFIISTYGPYASHIVGWYAKRRSPNAIWICDFRDLWTRNHVYPGIWPFTFVEWFLEGLLLRRCDLAVTVSEPLAAQLRHDHPKLRVEVIANGVDLEDLQSLSTERFFPDDDKIRIVYTGALHASHRNPEPLFEAVALLNPEQRERLEIIFVGPNTEIIQDGVQRLGLQSHVRGLKSIPRTQALKMQRDADVLLFLEQSHEKAKDGVLTGKLFEYIASGTRVWAVGVGPESAVGALLKESKSGHAFGKDVDAIRLALLSRLNEPRKTVGQQRSEDFIKNFDRKELANRLMDLVRSV